MKCGWSGLARAGTVDRATYSYEGYPKRDPAISRLVFEERDQGVPDFWRT